MRAASAIDHVMAVCGVSRIVSAMRRSAGESPASVRRICDKCKLIKRKGVVRVICEDPRHKQRQG